jgi:ligand-binding sensor domain-containing protein
MGNKKAGKLLYFFKIYFILTFGLPGVHHGITEAQETGDFFFQNLTTAKGLSSNFVQCIFRDSRGFLWIGTNNGLNRYDGQQIRVYHHDPENPFSLPRESIRRITEDQNGNLWLGADYGLIEFNPVTEKFNIYRHEAGNLKSLNNDHIPVPFIDSRNNLWVGTEAGLQLFDRQHHTFETFLPVSPDSVRKNPSLGWTGIIAEDQEHNIWCTGVEGLLRFDSIKRTLITYPFPDKKFGNISYLFIDHDNNFWVALWVGGFTLFHAQSGLFDPIDKVTNFRTNDFQNLSEWKDPSGVYWLVMCSANGLQFYNPVTKKKFMVQANSFKTHSLLDSITTYVYQDHENLLWIGTIMGLNLLDNADQRFHSRILPQRMQLNSKMPRSPMRAIYEETDKIMVTFLWGTALGIYSKDWKPLGFFPSIPPTDTSPDARIIFSIYKDFRGIHWISTNNGLVRFDMKKKSFKVYKPAGEKGDKVNTQAMMREIIHSDSTSFYVRSKNRGIYKFDFITEHFTKLIQKETINPQSLPENNLRTILKDSKNRLILVSVNAGLFIYDPARRSVEAYQTHPDVSINEAMTNLYLDPGISGETLWLNSAHGLLKFDLEKRKFELFNTRNGLANEFIISNAIDRNGDVWVAHNGGISRFDKTTRTFTNYSESDGLMFREFDPNMCLMEDGSICVGDQDMLVYFHPGQIIDTRNIPQVHINAVKVLNDEVSIVFDSLTRKKSLTLQYDQDLITVGFSVLNFSHQHKTKFYFRLDDQSTWLQVNEGIVNLAKLSPGNYILHVTGSNDSGILNSAGDSLYISILPPFYRTWWFLLLVFAGLIAVLVEIRRRGINRVKHDENIKTEFNKQLAQAETKALRAQMNPHFIFNSLNSINSFVIDQKHEIASDYLIKFSKLIRLILDNSRSEMISIEKELETLKLYVFLEAARFDNKFKCDYKIAADVNTNSIMIPPMLLQPFVENAIWHGLMQKSGEGNILIEIKKQNEEFLSISITDDGIGREKAAEIKSKSATHKSHGLKVTSQRIEMMNKLNSTGARVNIFDLKDGDGKALGTKVELIIPF